MKIFGKEVLGGSLWVERGRGENEIEGNVEVEACMLKPGLGMIPSLDISRNNLLSYVDPSQLVKGKNPFISPMNFIFVDSRPISCSRPGPFKSLLSLYKVYLRSALSANCTHDMIPPVSDPFIYLNIRCKVPGMYDPNIEPVKDDVLFHNWEGDVFTVVDGMFRGVYGELKKKEKLEGVKRPMGIGAVDFGVLLARKPAPSISHPAPSPAPAVEELKVTNQVIKSVEAGLQEDIDEYPDSEIDHWDGLTPPIVDPAISEPNHFTIHLEGASNAGQRRPTWGFSMSTNLVEEDEVEDDPGAEYLPHPPTPPHEIEASRKDITLSNPWVMAKMNTPVTQHSSSSREPVAQKSSGSAGLGLAGGDGMGEKANAQTHRHSIYPKVKGIVGGGESSTAPQKPRGLDKWVVSTSTRGGELQASVSSFLMDSTSSHPSEGNPSVEAVRENASAADRVGGYTTREFMTAADLMASVKEPDSGATSYNTRFAGVDGPGGVIVQSRGERNRNPRDRALWPNPLERRPFSHPDSEDGDDRSLNSSLSPVAKRRRLDKGKGKARAYQHDFPGDSDEVLEVDEQLDLLFTHPPPHPQLPQRGQKQISAGVRPQRKFVPPLLNQVTISSNSGTCYLGEEQEEQEEEEQEEDENETLSEKSSSLSSVTSPSGITPLLARSPHKNRQRAATSTLSIPGKKNTGTVNLKGFKNIPNEGDASSALAQPTRLAKPRRKPRHLLPLERVAEEDRVHNTLVTVQLKRSILPSASTSSGEGGEAVAEQNFAAFVTRVVQWNLNEYSSQRRWDGTGKEFAFRGEWIDGVLNEWLRTKVAEREREEVELGKGKNEGVSMGEDIGSIWTRERELLGGVTGWVEKGRWEGGREGEEEGGGGEEEGSGGEEAVGMRVGLGVRKLWTVWV